MKYNIRFANSTVEIQSANDLVAQIYFQKKYISDTKLPKFSNSKVVIVTNATTNELIGCASIRMPDGSFESEKLYHLSSKFLSKIGIKKSATVELGRFAIHPSAKEKGMDFAFFLMNWAMIKFLKNNSFTGWLAILKPQLYDCLVNFGYTLRNVDRELGLVAVNTETYKTYFNEAGKPQLVYSAIEENDNTFSRYNSMAERYILKSEL